MYEDCGINRVLGVTDVLPVFAWKLDNSKVIYDNEMLLKVTHVHLEAANLKQICNESMNDPETVKEKIIDLVETRGKLHNPYTDTGGLIAGTVERVGKDYINKDKVKVGDQVLVLASATMIPLHIDRIHDIDFLFGSIRVDGYGILYGNSSVIRRPAGIPTDLLMLAFEESASIYHVYQMARGNKDFLVIGSNILHVMIYGYAIRKAVGSGGRISALLYNTGEGGTGTIDKEVKAGIDTIFDEFDSVNSTHILKCTENLIRTHPELFDLSVNCADARGAEAINVLTTKPKGTVFFSSLINNYNIAVFLTEGLGKELNILCGDGYAENYDKFMYEMLSEIEIDVDRLSRIMHKSLRRNVETASANISADQERQQDPIAYDFIYKSQSMNELSRQIVKASKYDCSVLIEGETGVGKERVARLIHNMSNRNMHPCVKVNCASIPSTLMESEFFGYEPGAFTGASAKGKRGYFEQANKGILFLDEISELSLEMQAKLLRVLQDKEFYRLGGESPIKVDVRVLCATNKNLQALTSAGEFREDLYYRLAVLILSIPPLRKRKRDIIPLLEYYVNDFNKKNETRKQISDEGIQYLLEYEWPGNIRELENLVQRVMINSDEDTITQMSVIRELSCHRRWEGSASENQTEVGVVVPLGRDFRQSMDDYERQMIEEALRCHGSTRKAAEALGITQAAFMRKKKKHQL